MTTFQEQIRAVINSEICTKDVADYWLKRVEEGGLTRDEGSISHLGCYFIPYDLYNKKVFVVHNKKSGLWLFPGGHVDLNETPMQTLNREIEEELGLVNKIIGEVKPFLLTITPINHPGIMC